MDTDEKITLAVVMPVFNQAATITTVIEAWLERLDGLGVPFRFHVYNDGSTDGTRDVLNRLAEAHPGLRIHTKKNTGHGPTILQGYLDNRHAEWIFQTDSDDEVNADCFAAFWQQRHGYDFVIAHRRGRRASLSRKGLTWIARWVIRLVYGPTVGDVNAPYRLLRTAAFAPCFVSIPKNTFAPNLLVTGYAARRGVKTLEIDVPHQRPITGVVSTSSLRIVKGTLRSLGQVVAFRVFLAIRKP